LIGLPVFSNQDEKRDDEAAQDEKSPLRRKSKTLHATIHGALLQQSISSIVTINFL
jgi:hypothetical protein